MPGLARDFTDIDSAPDPERCVSYLDAVATAEPIAAGKRRRDRLLALRPGDAALDVGCGTGDDIRALASLVGPNGRVVGFDASRSLIAEARRRTTAEHGPVEFIVGDAHALPFEDGEFDAARIERTLQHVENPGQVLCELVRVVRPGGVIVTCEPDWGTLVFDATEPELARLAERIATSSLRHGWIGRQLRGRLLDAGCADATVTAETIVIDDYATLQRLGNIELLIAREPRLEALVVDLRSRAARGRLFTSLTTFTVCGRVT